MKDNATYFRRNRLYIVCIVVFCLPLIWAGTRRTLDNISNNVKDWLPDAFEETSDHTWFTSHFPNEQFILISWNGCTTDDPRVEEFARRLVPTDPGIPLPGEKDHPLLHASDKAAEAAAFEHPYEICRVDTKDGSEGAPMFHTVLTGPRLVHRLSEQAMIDEDVALERLKGSLIGEDGKKTCVVVTVVPEAVKGKQLRKTIAAVKDIAREIGVEPEPKPLPGNVFVLAWNAIGAFASEMVYGRNPSTAGVVLGGPPVDNEAINYEGEYTLWRLAGLCAFAALGISMACFRSIRLTAIVFWIALLSAGAALAAVFFTGQKADAVLLSMPALVLVLSMSGAIHIVNYYHDAIREKGLSGAVERAIRHGWFPCAMASLTTALGLGSLCVSQVIPISKFGIYSAFGVLASLLLLFFYLPALLDYFPSKKYAEKHACEGDEPRETFILRFWRWFGGKIIRHNVAVAVGCLIVMVFFAAGLFRIQTSVKLMKLFSADAEIIAHYTWLEDQLGPLVPMEVVVRVDNSKCDLTMLDRMRLVQGLSSRIKHAEGLEGDIGGVLSAATMGPDISRSYSFGNAARERQTNSMLEQSRAQFRDYLTVEGDPTLAEMGVPNDWILLLADHGIDSLKDVEHRDPAAEIPGFTSEELTQLDQMVRDWQAANGVELWRISPRIWSLKKDIDYAAFVGDLKHVVDPLIADQRDVYGVEGVDVVYTGLVPLVYKTQHVLLESLVESLATAFILICFVMILVLRSPSAGLLSMIPNVFPVVVIFGFMGWWHVLVDIGTMMTSTVALGVAVDDTMHFLTWFRHGLDRGYDRKKAVMVAYERCATAMTQTTLIGGLGLAAFGFSTFTPTQRFGVLMLVLLFTALVGDLVFLPALLTSPLGRFFDRWRKEGAKRDNDPDSGEDRVETLLATGPSASPPHIPTTDGDGQITRLDQGAESPPGATRHFSPHRRRRASM